jgi:hypothetical protein
MNARRLTFPVVVLCALVGGLLFVAAPVLAANGHGLTNSFGSETSTVKDSEPLSKPTAVAWSAKTNEIYVLDTGHDGVARFSVAGDPEGEFSGSETPAKAFSSPNAIAIDNDPGSPSYGDVYVSDAGHNVIDKFSSEGKYLSQLTGRCELNEPLPCSGSQFFAFAELGGVAVDPAGNLWVYDANGVDKFDDAANNAYVSREEVGLGVTPGIAVDSKDNVYFVFGFFHNVLRFAPGVGFEAFAGGFTGCGCVTGVAVDQTAGPLLDGVYVDQGTSVAQYPPDPAEGSQPEVFGSGALAEGSGIAVSSAHTVYVADTKTGDVDVFTEGPKPAQPTAEKTGTVEGTSATLEGTLAGGESSYHFAYNTGSTCVGGQTTPTVAATGSPTVSTEVTGLIAKTEYTFCLVAEDTYGQEPGAPVTFTTTASTPAIERTSSSVRRVEATLEGTVNPELESASCVFQYGTSEAYGQETPCVPGALGEEGIGVTVTATLKGLAPDTTYDYRILATNGTGTRPGPNETFTTEVITPTQVETAPAIDVTATSAKLGGQVNPQGGAMYYIEYGSPTCSLNGIPNFAWWLCAAKSAEAGPLSGDSTQTVASIEVTGLTPGTTYRYWIVAHNANGSERGEEAMFTTPTATNPAVVGSTPTPTASAVVPAPKPVAVKPPSKRRSAAQEKAEKLSKALKQCKKLTPKAKRKACETQAHKSYGPKTKSKPKSSKRGH